MTARAPCPRCLRTGQEDAELSKAIRLYREALDGDTRCGEGEYSRRLEICGDCEGMVNATCVHCGCYIGMRAAVTAKRCPHPGGDRWRPSVKKDTVA